MDYGTPREGTQLGEETTTPEHPVTLGDLRLPCEHGEAKRHWVNPGGARTGYDVWDGSPWQCSAARPVTVADLMSPEIRPLVVSALRAEGVLVVEKVDSEWPDWAYEKISNRLTSIGGTTYWQKPSHRFAYAKVCMDALADVPLSHVTLPGDALAEAQPFPPAGG